MLEKTLESHLDCKEIQPFNPKGISSEYSLEGLMLKLKLQYFGHLMQRTGSFEKPLLLGGAAFLLVPQRVGHFCIGPQRSFSRTFTSNLICPVNCPQIHSLTPHFCHYIKRHSWASLRLRDEEAACQCRKHESDHWSGKIPHAVEQLNPCAAITEPVL